MNATPSDNTPCDGKVPPNGTMPELGSRVTYHKKFVHIDFRGLSSPTPLVGTLKTLANLYDDQYMEAIYPQMPIHLFPALMEEGWSWDVIEEAESGVTVKIFRKGSEK